MAKDVFMHIRMCEKDVNNVNGAPSPDLTHVFFLKGLSGKKTGGFTHVFNRNVFFISRVPDTVSMFSRGEQNKCLQTAWDRHVSPAIELP